MVSKIYQNILFYPSQRAEYQQVFLTLSVCAFAFSKENANLFLGSGDDASDNPTWQRLFLHASSVAEQGMGSATGLHFLAAGMHHS
jgi:hypothetical protein